MSSQHRAARDSKKQCRRRRRGGPDGVPEKHRRTAEDTRTAAQEASESETEPGRARSQLKSATEGSLPSSGGTPPEVSTRGETSRGRDTYLPTDAQPSSTHLSHPPGIGRLRRRRRGCGPEAGAAEDACAAGSEEKTATTEGDERDIERVSTRRIQPSGRVLNIVLNIERVRRRTCGRAAGEADVQGHTGRGQTAREHMKEIGVEVTSEQAWSADPSPRAPISRSSLARSLSLSATRSRSSRPLSLVSPPLPVPA